MASQETDWWHMVFGIADPASEMGGMDGREGVGHPTHDWFSEHVPEGSSVLDVGCCNGHALENFLRHDKKIQYYGVDHLQQMVNYCQEAYPQAQFMQSDASDLSAFPDNSFDYVLSRHVWEHLNHYSQHFMEMWRVAKKEVVIVGFLELKPELDRLQYGVTVDGHLYPHWYNQYGKTQLEAFIRYNMTEDFTITEKFSEEVQHPIIVIRKAKV